ncbi:MAG: class I SAM-dependent methyltransferase [Magnetococcales bacterium]|nr:class I SAM-dependent methyltransferase [Magnetococcales bacterium]
MKRIPEPQLMLDKAQAKAYAEADFSLPHNHFVQLFQDHFPQWHNKPAYALDLGCGPGDVTRRFAQAHPQCLIHGIDGSREMIDQGRRMLARQEEGAGQISLIHGLLPGASLPRARYEIILSNSLLHHLDNPQTLWQTIHERGLPGASIGIMDLLRPGTITTAKELVESHAGNAPQILKDDFYNSLLAAYTADEIEAQLQEAALDFLEVQVVSDRHITIMGTLPES